MPQARLTAADREFFAALADVVFGNPFTPQRAELILRLVPGASLGDLTRDREALPRVVAPRLQRLQDQHLGEEERRLLEAALWYVCYHRAVPQLDALIEQQAKQAGAALAVTFADDVIAELLRGGLYFIERSLAGECESMRRLREALWNNVFTHDMRGYEAGLWNRMEDFSTLLLGETGTGKGSAAAAIGRSEFIPYAAGERRFAANFTDTFIAINLSQFPETLIESALFLDEIGEVSMPVQIKLLQVLQERTLTPLGGHEKKRFSGRVIAATNRRLADLRRGGRFRDDFFYRLCSDVIEVPTLRQRIAESPGELPQMVRLMVARIIGSESNELVAAGFRDPLAQRRNLDH